MRILRQFYEVGRQCYEDILGGSFMRIFGGQFYEDIWEAVW